MEETDGQTSASTEPGPEGRAAQRRALVTGASTGIGAAFAARLAGEGYDLVIVARSRDRLEELAKRLEKGRGVRVEVLAADLTNPEDLGRVERRVAEDGALDLLVNNAGFGTFGRFAELDAGREEEEIRLNVVALVRLTRAALPAMIRRGQGSIVNVSSMAAFQPAPFNTVYGATKAFVNSFTEGLHEELRGTGVRVQALCPGFTRTEFQERAGIDATAVPGFLWMSAEEVAEASLAALRRGELVCVPGLGNRVAAAATALVPRALASRAVGLFGRRRLGD